tara:strand:+ start:473 stop:1648 length:1176 start_codon:yes stop_codon:yes gene_type:complete
MSPLEWFKKEKPFLSLQSMFGGAAGALVQGAKKNVDATGGTISEYNDKTIHRFTSPGTFVINSYKEPFTLEYVIIGGGGGGGGGVGGVGRSGGGGAGLVLVDSVTYNLSPGAATYPVTVGSGGAGGSTPTNPLNESGQQGQASSISGMPSPISPPLHQASWPTSITPTSLRGFYATGGGFGAQGGPNGDQGGYGGSRGGSGGDQPLGPEGSILYNPNPLFIPPPGNPPTGPFPNPTSPNNVKLWKWQSGDPTWGDATRGMYGQRGGQAAVGSPPPRGGGGGGGGAGGQGENSGPTEPAGDGGEGMRLPITFRDPTNPFGAPGNDPVVGPNQHWVAGGGAGSPGGDRVNGGGSSSGGGAGSAGQDYTGGGGGAGKTEGGPGGPGQVLIAYPN